MLAGMRNVLLLLAWVHLGHARHSPDIGRYNFSDGIDAAPFRKPDGEADSKRNHYQLRLLALFFLLVKPSAFIWTSNRFLPRLNPHRVHSFVLQSACGQGGRGKLLIRMDTSVESFSHAQQRRTTAPQRLGVKFRLTRRNKPQRQVSHELERDKAQIKGSSANDDPSGVVELSDKDVSAAKAAYKFLEERSAKSFYTDAEDDRVRELITAVRFNDARSVRKLLKEGVPANSALKWGIPALHLAARDGALDAAQALLSATKADEVRDERGQTALHAAASVGQGGMCALLASAGADVEAGDAFGWTPLRWAVLNGHANATAVLLEAGADGISAVSGLSPLALASAAGHFNVLKALLDAGVEEQYVHAPALPIARSMGKTNVVALLQARGFTEDRMPFTVARTASVISTVHADRLLQDRSLWNATFATSTALHVRGLVKPWVDKLCISADELGQRWGKQNVTVFFSPDAMYQRVVLSKKAADDLLSVSNRQFQPPYHLGAARQEMSFQEYLKLLPSQGVTEHSAVSQSCLESIEHFDGLSSMSTLLKSFIGERDATSHLWVCKPPKHSFLHYDTQDSVLVQLAGTKVFTIVDPGPMHGLTVYPTILHGGEMRRIAPGQFVAPEALDAVITHFPLVNVSWPDLESHPMFAYARVMKVEVQAGDALMLPAYWYHQVESLINEQQEHSELGLNIAVNYWFDSADSGEPRADMSWPSRLHRELRLKLRVDNHFNSLNSLRDTTEKSSDIRGARTSARLTKESSEFELDSKLEALLNKRSR